MVDRDVLVVTHPLEPASENHVEALLNILAAITSVSLVTANLRADSTIRENFDVVEISTHSVGNSIPVAALRFIRNQLRLCKTIWNRDEEIVLFFGAVSYVLPIAFARLLGRTVVLEPRGNVPLTLRLQWEQRIPASLARGLAGFVWGLEQLGYWMAHGIITYTQSMAEEIDVTKYETKLYPSGARYVDTERFFPRTQFDDRQYTVGYIGRLDEEKGIRMLTEVAKQLPAEITLRFIGDGDLRPWLEQDLGDEIQSGSVEIAGWIEHENIPTELNKLRLLVLPSQPTEGLPTVILESLACGTPVYVTPVSGVPDIVSDGETGFLMEEQDSKSIANRIENICRCNNLSTISDNGRELITDSYNFDGAVERYQKILQQI